MDDIKKINALLDGEFSDARNACDGEMNQSLQKNN
jgi:hypothetical protein